MSRAQRADPATPSSGGLPAALLGQALATVHNSRISFERREEILHEIARACKEANLLLLRTETRTRPGSVPQKQVTPQRSPELTGYIYLLSNEVMPGLLKIGFTAGAVERRADEIGASTGIPVPFKVARTFPVYENLYDIEREIHATLGHCRVSERREFFRISVEEAVQFIAPIVTRACTSLFVEILYQGKRPNQSQQSPS